MKKFLMIVLGAGLFLSIAMVGSAKAEDATKEGDGAPGIHFVELNPLVLPVINNRGVTQMVSLVIAVEVDSQEKADQVTKYSPRLTDAYLSELYGSFSRTAPEGGIIPIGYVKERLNATSAKVLGDHIVDDILVQVLQSRRT